MSTEKSRKLLIGVLLTVILCVSSYFMYDSAFADHSKTQTCYTCHTLKSSNVRQNTSSVVNTKTEIGNTRLCEVCHELQLSNYWFTDQAASAHPVHTINNYYGTDPFYDFMSPITNIIAGNDPDSPFYFSTAASDTNRSVECWNCHNSNHVTDFGPNQQANGYPNHTFEQQDYPSDVSTTNPGPPWDINRYQLYTAELGSQTPGTMFYTNEIYDTVNNDFSFCFGGQGGVKNRGTYKTIYDGELSPDVFPGCHGTATGVLDKATYGTVTGFTIEDYYKVATDTGGVTTRAQAPANLKPTGHYIQASGDRIACYSCHGPHGSTTNIRLYTGPKGTGNLETVTDICRDCHGYDESGYPVPSAIDVATEGDIDGLPINQLNITPMPPPYSSFGSLIGAHAAGAAATDPCYNCHNAHMPTPDKDGPLPCRICHLTASDPLVNQDIEDLDGEGNPLGIKPWIDVDQWDLTGHGNMGQTLGNRPKQAAGFDENYFPADPLQDGCIMYNDAGTWNYGCHSIVDPHYETLADGGNTYRLAGINGGAFDSNAPDAVCNSAACHPGPGTAGVPDRHDFTNAYPKGKCFDCHDPHGDSAQDSGNTDLTVPGQFTGIPDTVNLAGAGTGGVLARMLQRQPVMTDRWDTSGGSSYGDVRITGVSKRDENDSIVYVRGYDDRAEFVNNAAAGNGVCEVCHTAIDTKYFQRDDADQLYGLGEAAHVGNAPAKLTEACALECHTHEKKFKPGGANCLVCHAVPIGARPAIVFKDNATGLYWFRDPSITASLDPAMSQHVINSTNGVTEVECVVCHFEGMLQDDIDNPGQYIITVNNGDAGTEGSYHMMNYYNDDQIDLRDQNNAGTVIAYAMNAVSTYGGVDYATAAADLNPNFCGGCHDGTATVWANLPYGGAAATPFNNSGITVTNGTVTTGANDTSSLANYAIFTATYWDNGNVTNYSKVPSIEGKSAVGVAGTTGGYNTVPQLIKAYSPHRNPTLNDTKSEYINGANGTPKIDTIFNTNTNGVACLHCHPPHGSDTTSVSGGGTGTFLSLGAREVMTRNTEPQLCWNCHSGAAADVLDFYGDTDRTSGSPLQWGTIAGNSWDRTGSTDTSFDYKTAEISNIHPVRNAGRRPNADPTRVFCSVCHDPHGVDTNNTTHDPFMVPILRVDPNGSDPGGWMTSPYKEDRAGQKVGSEVAELITSYSGAGWWGNSGYNTDANWRSGTGPRVEPLNYAGGNNAAKFAFNRPDDIGGGYGAGPGAGHDGYFLNDNTFGLTVEGYMSEGAVSVTRDPYGALENGTGATTANFTQKFAGFCVNCHPKAVTDPKALGGWAGHGAVYDETAANDVYGITIARHNHGGSWNTSRYGNVGIAGTSQDDAVGNSKWAVQMGQGTSGQSNWQITPGGRINYHEFTCSKCHTPHASVINRLMRTNCLSGATDTTTKGTLNEKYSAIGYVQPSLIETLTVGNYTLSDTNNRRGQGSDQGNTAYPFPAIPADTGLFGEEYAMHCHNSFNYAEGVAGSGWLNQNNTTTTGTYPGGWLLLVDTQRTLGCGESTLCHDVFRNLADATAAGFGIDQVITTGAHQTHVNGVSPTQGFAGDAIINYGIDDFATANFDCRDCHQYSSTSTGVYDNPEIEVHNDGNGVINFVGGDTKATTPICNNCHSTDAVGLQNAKDAWVAWDSKIPNNSLYCVNCHNESAGQEAIFGDVMAANIYGSVAGAGYGFYENGHGGGNTTLPDGTTQTARQDTDGLLDLPAFACTQCHDPSLSHVDSDPISGSTNFRLDLTKFVRDITDYKNAGPGSATANQMARNACLDCHESDSYVTDAGRNYLGGATNLSESDPANQFLNHDPASMIVANNTFNPNYDNVAGEFTPTPTPNCNDCHDLHGSAKPYMVGSQYNGILMTVTPTESYVTTQYAGAPGPSVTQANNEQLTTNNGSLGDTGTPKGVCVICHTQTTHDTRTDIDNHMGAAGAGNPMVCVGCHPHVKAFQPGGCNGCHGYPPGFDFEPSKPNADARAGGVYDYDTAYIPPERQPADGDTDLNAYENGAHMVHTLASSGLSDDEGNLVSGPPHNAGATTENLGYPKLGFTCLSTPAKPTGGCHVTDSGLPLTYPEGDHNANEDTVGTGRRPPSGDILFDLLDANGYFTIDKSLPNGLPADLDASPTITRYIGDGAWDKLADNTNEYDGLAGNPPYRGSTGMISIQGTSSAQCFNIYCHSNADADIQLVGSRPQAPVWSTAAAASPIWDDIRSVYCGTCHEDSWDATLAGTPWFIPEPAAHAGMTDSAGIAIGGSNTQMNTNSHATHVRDYALDQDNSDVINGPNLVQGLSCDTCHYQRGKSLNVSTAYHVNGLVEINFFDAGSIGTNLVPYPVPIDLTLGTYTSGINPDFPAPLAGMGRPGVPEGTCDNVYCHSNGFEAKNGAPAGIAYQQPTWGGALRVGIIDRCTGCHGITGTTGAPDYVSGGVGSATANSHEGHVGSHLANLANPIVCKDCHSTTIDTTSTTIAYGDVRTHVNGSIDVNGPRITSYDQATKDCVNSCHVDTITWGYVEPGVDKRSCFVCHSREMTEANVRPTPLPETIPAPETAAELPNRANKDQYLTKGHGNDTQYQGNLPNLGASLIWPGVSIWYDQSISASNGCISQSGVIATPQYGCHVWQNTTTGYIGHWDDKQEVAPTNLDDNFFLGDSYYQAFSGLCTSTNCHTGQQTHSDALDGGSCYDWDAGMGAANTWATVSNPPKCTDCHDPHGDGNDFMVKYAVSTIYGSLNTLTRDYGTPSLPMTAVAMDVSVTQDNNDYYDNSDAGTHGICQVCHTQPAVYKNRDATYGDPTVCEHGFLDDTPNQGRECTECHLHLRAFGRPEIDITVPVPTPATCADCHLTYGACKTVDPNNNDVDNYNFNLGPGDFCATRAMIDGTQWETSGHGQPGPNLQPSAKWPAGAAKRAMTVSCNEPLAVPMVGGYSVSVAATGCHDEYVPHGDLNNPFRLAGNGEILPKEIVKRLCINCHVEIGCPSRTSDPSDLWGIHAITDALEYDTNIWSTNMYEAGLCVDCHDVHGDSANDDASQVPILDTNYNAAMLQREVVWEDRWNTNFGVANAISETAAPDLKIEPITRYAPVGGGVYSDFVKQDPAQSISGICEACHRNAGTRWFRRKDADLEALPGFHNGPVCLNCHKHKEAFAPPDPCDPCPGGCVACHTGVDQQFNNVDYSKHDIDCSTSSRVSSTGNLNVDCANNECLICHDLTNHTNGDVELLSINGSTAIVAPNPSAYTKHAGVGISDLAWGDIKDDVNITAGEQWCEGCHGSTPFSWPSMPGVDAPNVFANFLTTGHGARDNATGNFTERVPPEDGTGRTSCTACHNYHGVEFAQSMVTRRNYISGTTYGDVFPYYYDESITGPPPPPVYDLWDEGLSGTWTNGQPVGATADPKEIFCLNACHVNDGTYGDGETAYVNDLTVLNTRGTTFPYQRGHMIRDLGNAVAGAPSTPGNAGAATGPRDINWHLSQKHVGFQLGGADVASQYVNDPAAGELTPEFTSDMLTLSLILPMGEITMKTNYENTSRALCRTCHDPHGGDPLNNAWNQNQWGGDDGMLRDKDVNGTTLGTIDEACDACHM